MRSGDPNLIEYPSKSDPADLVAIGLSEPQVPVGAGRDPKGIAAGCRDSEFGDHARDGDPADPVVVLGEPQVSVRSGCDVLGKACRVRKRIFGEPTRGGDPGD